MSSAARNRNSSSRETVINYKWMSGSTVLHTETYTYDAAGQLTSAVDPAATYNYVYDGLGRQTSLPQHSLQVDCLATGDFKHQVISQPIVFHDLNGVARF